MAWLGGWNGRVYQGLVTLESFEVTCMHEGLLVSRGGSFRGLFLRVLWNCLIRWRFCICPFLAIAECSI